MLKKYKKHDGTAYFSRIMLDMKALKSELNEHRYYLERMVERRTLHLLKKIAFLESCNARLCNKLAIAHQEISALRKQSTFVSPVNDSGSHTPQLKLCIADKLPNSIESQEHAA